MFPAADWTYPTRIRFGAGRIVELPEACLAAGIARPLLVTDRGVAALAATEALLARLAAAGLPVEVFAEVEPNPGEATVTLGAARMREGGHDGVIALGGGSALDAGKAIALLRGQSLPLFAFAAGHRTAAAREPVAAAPVIAVPTTAGSGSEASAAAVVTDPAGPAKRILLHEALMPRAAILDPELTLSMPADLTAATGMDALAHCLEAYSAAGFHPMAEGIAAEGVRLVREYLPRATADGSDLEARGAMLVAATLGATAFQKGLGAVHALSHPIGARHGLHHGLANGVLLPYVLDFNRDEIEAPMDRLAGWLGLEGGLAGIVDAVLRLRRDTGIPHTLDRIGVPEADLPAMAAMAAADPTARTNPRTLTEADALELYDRALNGRLG